MNVDAEGRNTSVDGMKVGNVWHYRRMRRIRICMCLHMYAVCICYQNMGAEKWKKVMIRGSGSGGCDGGSGSGSDGWWKVELTINAHFSLGYGEKRRKSLLHIIFGWACMCEYVSDHFSFETFRYILLRTLVLVMAMSNDTHSHTFSDFLSKRAKNVQKFFHITCNMYTKFLIRTRFSIMLITFYNSRVFFSCALLLTKIPKIICNERLQFARTHAHTHTDEYFWAEFICWKGVTLFNSIYCPYTLGGCMCIVYLCVEMDGMNANADVCVAFVHTDDACTPLSFPFNIVTNSLLDSISPKYIFI